MRVGLIAVSMLMLAGCDVDEQFPNATTGENATNAVVATPTPTPLPGPRLGDIALMQPLHAFGTEPFWGLDVGPGDIRFTDASVETPEPVPFYPVPPVISGNTATWTTKNRGGVVMVLTLTLKPCLEVGEEDQTEPFTALLKVGDKTFHGCAGPERPGAPDEEMDNVTTP